jgi:hypothetical protein
MRDGAEILKRTCFLMDPAERSRLAKALPASNCGNGRQSRHPADHQLSGRAPSDGRPGWGIPKIVCIVEIGMKVMNMLLHAATVVLVSRFRIRCSGGLSPTQRGRLDCKRLPLSYWRSNARTPRALHDGGGTHRSAGCYSTRHDPIRYRYAVAGFCRRIVRAGPASGREQVLHYPARLDGARQDRKAFGRPAH